MRVHSFNISAIVKIYRKKFIEKIYRKIKCIQIFEIIIGRNEMIAIECYSLTDGRCNSLWFCRSIEFHNFPKTLNAILYF